MQHFLANLRNRIDRKSDSIRTIRLKRTMINAMYSTLFNVSKSCELVGINRCTHYRWLNSDQEYAKALWLLKEFMNDYVESKLLEKIAQGDIRATIFYLSCQAQDRGYFKP